jgi:hypothetical protein
VTKQSWLSVARVVFAGSSIVAMVYQLTHPANKEVDHRVANFFSFFTIESNIFAAAILLIAVWRNRQGVPPSPTFDLLRGAATLYMATTGIVYGVLLSGYQEELQTTIPWVDTIVHMIFPLYLVVDWYPYPFLNPETAGGYGAVATYCVGIAIVIALFAAIIAALSKREPERSMATAVATAS